MDRALGLLLQGDKNLGPMLRRRTEHFGTLAEANYIFQTVRLIEIASVYPKLSVHNASWLEAISMNLGIYYFQRTYCPQVLLDSNGGSVLCKYLYKT